LASFSPGPFGKLISLWHTFKLLLSKTSALNCPKVSRLQLKTTRTITEATQESLWSEASWKGVEFIPCGQAHLIGLHSLLIDDCVFFQGDIIFMVYMDDGILLGNDNTQLQQAIKKIQDLGLNIKDQGHSTDYVGVSIKKLCNVL
jgi:hypothetical protein